MAKLKAKAKRTYKMKVKATFLSIILFELFSFTIAFGQGSSYQSFENIYMDADASTISSFIQDSQGVMWIGTVKGLYSYDGYSSQAHFSSENGTDVQIHCGVSDKKGLLYLGSDKGVLVYSYLSDQYEKSIEVPSSVRSLVLDNGTLWIGTLGGLFRYSIAHSKLERVDSQSKGLPNQTIYSIIKVDNALFIGTYDGLCTYSPTTKKFNRIPLPKETGKSNVFVNSLLEDKGRKCIWIGTEGALFKYHIFDKSVDRIAAIAHNSIKSLAIDSKNALLIGTDNGMFTYIESSGWKHIFHDSRVSASLTNNIIWTIFIDRDKNCWLGTDFGISLYHQNRSFEFIPISQMSGNGNGNRFSSIYIDSRKNFWFGGTNGLLLKEWASNRYSSTLWYKIDDPQHSLSHNRIRKIYEDKSANLWIATDGSLNRFDYQSRRFIHYSIVDKSLSRNANWCYDLFEDNSGKLWVASFLGGIFIVDKSKLLAVKGSSYIADYNLTTRDGLSENYVSQIVPDRNSSVWVLFRNRDVNRIDIRTRAIRKVSFEKELWKEKPNLLFCDSNGSLWVGFKGGVLRITPSTDKREKVVFDEFNPKDVLAIAEENNNIWISTTNSVWVINRHTLKVEQRLNSTAQHFASIFFDKNSKSVYLGGVDGYAVTSSATLNSKKKESPIILAGLYINNRLLPNLPGDEGSIRYAEEITVRHNQNNLTFEFSDLEYSSEEKNSFVYKLEGANDEWSTLKQNDNRISYSNLAYGTYKLVICKLSITGKPSSIKREITIKILPPWYLTAIAKIFYLLLLIGAIAGVINFFTVKNRLKMERKDKESSLELSKMKIDFFTNISHELKTPLSLIIAPLGKLLFETKEGEKKTQLRLAHQNAMKLNTLIYQALDFDKLDNRSTPQLILSKIEFVEFARSLFSVFQDTPRDKKINFGFRSNCESLFIDVDVVKIESVLNNIIYNAIKFTPEGGEINLSLHHSSTEKTLQITLSDTGAGIAEQDLPHIFQRFFQSSNAEKHHEGTGIGLYLVKTYTELHGGTVDITSKENAGTTICLTFPIKEHHQAAVLPSKTEEVRSANAPEILIVEDNSDIANVVCSTLGTSYNYRKAANGKVGLTMAQEKAPDLIISDIMMPVMDGLEMCRKLRKNITTATTPIILLTAKESIEIEKESARLNIDSFITKPFDPDILKLKVESIIAKNKKIEEKMRLETLASPKMVDITSVNEKFLSDITAIIEENISNSEFNVNELSRLSDYSVKQLYRKIKQLTGYSPVDYIKSIRMKKAAMLLSQKKFTIAEVMYMVGFSSHSYFSKCFQVFFDMTPRQFLDKNNI